jgi:glycosyltransferase involved in cell wall biosynthesis
MESSPAIKVLLATYNGEKFLSDQLDSLFNQTSNNWSLVVFDDGSTDNTINILSSFREKYPDDFELIGTPNQSNHRPLGARDSFGLLLSATEADYYYFCDQDDRWSFEKIERMNQSMRELESEFGQETPLLIHTDLRVVDHSLQVISESFWHYQNLDPQNGASLHKLIVQNVVTGCTMMINRALRDQALPIPNESILHDWWLALVAAAFGKIASISDPMVDYRQHIRNEVGAHKFGSDYLLNRVQSPDSIRFRLKAVQNQADAFVQRFQSRLDPREFRIIKGFADLSQRGYFARRLYLMKYSFLKKGFIRNVGMMWFI